MAATAPGAAYAALRREPGWERHRPAMLLRALLQALLLLPIARWLCRPLTVRGRRHALCDGPVVFAANHCSHADTALILRALPRRRRRRTAPAAARDYFFRSRVSGAAVALLTGAFPFDRSGDGGLRRAECLLAAGWSVLLFPEGTRSRHGSMAGFRCGVGALAAGGATIVPVGIAGTRDVLPPGGRLPRQAPASVIFGPPLRFTGGAPAKLVTGRVQDAVTALAAQAAAAVRPARTTWWQRVRALACSPSGLILSFVWAVAEATVFPVVPDLAVFLMAVAAPARFVPLALCAAAGSVAGGAAAQALAAGGAGDALLDGALLVTGPMREQAAVWLNAEGARGLLHQPLSGVPFKVFALQSAGVDAARFLAWSGVVRVGRLLAVGAVAAALGTVSRGWMRRFYGAFALYFTILFALGLARVVQRWS